MDPDGTYLRHIMNCDGRPVQHPATHYHGTKPIQQALWNPLVNWIKPRKWFSPALYASRRLCALRVPDWEPLFWTSQEGREVIQTVISSNPRDFTLDSRRFHSVIELDLFMTGFNPETGLLEPDALIMDPDDEEEMDFTLDLPPYLTSRTIDNETINASHTIVPRCKLCLVFREDPLDFGPIP